MKTKTAQKQTATCAPTKTAIKITQQGAYQGNTHDVETGKIGHALCLLSFNNESGEAERIFLTTDEYEVIGAQEVTA